MNAPVMVPIKPVMALKISMNRKKENGRNSNFNFHGLTSIFAVAFFFFCYAIGSSHEKSKEAELVE